MKPLDSRARQGPGAGRRRALLCISLLLLLPAAGAGEPYPPGQLCVTLEPGHSIQEVNDRWGTTTLVALVPENLYLLFIDGVEDIEAFAAAMSQDPAVATSEANYFLQTPEAVRQMVIGAVGGTWGDYQDQEITQRIGLEEAHGLSRGAGVTIAVLDTGVDPDHSALAGRLLPYGIDLVDNDPDPWEEANGIDDDGDGLIDEGFGHGTMVAGIIALVAPDAKILPVRVLDDEGRGELFTVCRGILYALMTGADVVNLSFGSPLSLVTMALQFVRADLEGVLIVAAAGNENRSDPPYYPAYDHRAFMITALDSLDVKADFADYNAKVLVSAPGVGVRSAYPGDDWGIGSGCSFAAPFVAGEAALILSLYPGLQRPQVESWIGLGVEQIDEIPANAPYAGQLGTGRIYLPLALEGPAAAEAAPRPDGLALRAWPNPSRGLVAFEIPRGGGPEPPRIDIFDPSGRLVREIGGHGGRLLWKGDDFAGREVPPGLYLARVSIGERSRAVRLILLR